MHREIASDSDQLERFRREARSVAQLNHPHIVTVIDAGEEPSPDERRARRRRRPAWRLRTSCSSTSRARRSRTLIRREGPLEIPQAIAYAIEIARALGAAHERLIVHRDVKPQNVLIGAEGGAKITDFGIARTLTEEGLTMDGRVLGTTDYVSPEQALGQPVTGQSDLYSLGDRPLRDAHRRRSPSRRDSPVAVAMKHVREDVPDVQLAAPGGLRRDRRGRRSRDRQGPRPRATPTPRAWSPTSRRCSRSRPPARARPPARSRPCCARCPGTTRRRLPWRMRHPARWIVSLALLAAIVALALVARRRARAPRHAASRPDVRRAAGAARRCRSARPRPTTTTRSAPAPKTATDDQNVVDGDPNTTLEHRAVLRRHAQEGRRRRRRPVPRRRPGRGRQGDRDPDARRPASPRRSTSPTTSTSSLPYGDSTPLTARGWQGPVGARRRRPQRRPHPAQRSAGARYRYYLRLDHHAAARTCSRRRSPSSRCSSRPLERRSAQRAPLVALERQPAEAVDELRVGDPGGLHQLRVHARRREAGHRVQLVHQHPLAVDEEVDPREPLAAGVRERLAAPAPAPARARSAEIRAGTISSMPPGVYFAS